MSAHLKKNIPSGVKKLGTLKNPETLYLIPAFSSFSGHSKNINLIALGKTYQ